MKTPCDITDADLRQAYKQAELARLGISFDAAKSDHALHSGLVGMVRATRDRAIASPIHYTGSRMLHQEDVL